MTLTKEHHFCSWSSSHSLSGGAVTYLTYVCVCLPALWVLQGRILPVFLAGYGLLSLVGPHHWIQEPLNPMAPHPYQAHTQTPFPHKVHSKLPVHMNLGIHSPRMKTTVPGPPPTLLRPFPWPFPLHPAPCPPRLHITLPRRPSLVTGGSSGPVSHRVAS